MRRQRRQGVLGFVLPLLVLVALAPVGPAAQAVTSATKLSDSCTLVTKADVTAAFAKLDAALQPTSVSDPTRSKPTNQAASARARVRRRSSSRIPSAVACS